jgi:hypothetical protein
MIAGLTMGVNRAPIIGRQSPRHRHREKHRDDAIHRDGTMDCFGAARLAMTPDG